MQYAPTAYGAIAACAGVGPTRTLLTRSANDKVITSRHGRQARTDEKPIWMDTCRLSPTAPPDGGLNKGRPAMMALRSAFLSRCPLPCGGMCLTSDQGEEARYEQSAERHRNLPIHRPRRQHAPLGAPSPHHAARPRSPRCAAPLLQPDSTLSLPHSSLLAWRRRYGGPRSGSAASSCCWASQSAASTSSRRRRVECSDIGYAI